MYRASNTSPVAPLDVSRRPGCCPTNGCFVSCSLCFSVFLLVPLNQLVSQGATTRVTGDPAPIAGAVSRSSRHTSCPRVLTGRFCTVPSLISYICLFLSFPWDQQNVLPLSKTSCPIPAMLYHNATSSKHYLLKLFLFCVLGVP